MKLLLDTHVLLWWLEDPTQIAEAARIEIANPPNAVYVSAVSIQEIVIKQGHTILPALVEQGGSAARFAWDEFFYAEHHNPYTQRAYQGAVRRFLVWCEERETTLPQISSCGPLPL
jgi:hypothetical protein